MEWRDWVEHCWKPFETKFDRIVETQTTCQINHLPHIKADIEDNSKQIVKTRRWIYFLAVLIVLIVIETDKVDTVIELAKRFLGG